MSAKIDSRNMGGSTSYVIEGATQEEVEEAIVQIERSYHPVGYGTSFRPITQREDGTFVAFGDRSNSCD